KPSTGARGRHDLRVMLYTQSGRIRVVALSRSDVHDLDEGFTGLFDAVDDTLDLTQPSPCGYSVSGRGAVGDVQENAIKVALFQCPGGRQEGRSGCQPLPPLRRRDSISELELATLASRHINEADQTAALPDRQRGAVRSARRTPSRQKLIDARASPGIRVSKGRRSGDPDALQKHRISTVR